MAVTITSTSLALILLLLFAPLALFLRYGWKDRKDNIVSLFPDGAVYLYYATYFPASRSKGTTQDDLAEDFDRRYGRHHFIFPALVLLAVSSYVGFLCIHTVIAGVPSDPKLIDWQLPAA